MIEQGFKVKDITDPVSVSFFVSFIRIDLVLKYERRFIRSLLLETKCVFMCIIPAIDQSLQNISNAIQVNI